MNTTTSYLTYVQTKLNELVKSQSENIISAAKLVSDSCQKDGRFYVFGSGHSHIVAEDIYIRAGGLAYVKAILTPELMLHEMPNKSTFLERLNGYSSIILDLYKVSANDCLMIVSNSGRNSVPVEMALCAKERGTKVIAITSLAHSQAVSSRHHSGKKLYQLADVTIDNGADMGDAAFSVSGYATPTGPISSILGTTIAQAIIAQAVDNLIDAGIQPPIFKSSNLEGADDYNNELFDKYYGYWK